MTSAANTGALTRLLEQATEPTAQPPNDARRQLNALAPYAVRLLTDMAAWMEKIYAEPATSGQPHDKATRLTSYRALHEELRPLLARFAELEARAAVRRVEGE